MIISSKAGHEMWSGPYGDGGSRKSLMASIDQSLKRTGLDYFDIFYTHRYDSQTPVEETIQTLIDIVKQGKALYIGVSKYPPEQARKAYEMMLSQNVRCLIYQDKYNLLNREPETQAFPVIEEYGIGFISFSPLAQGLLTNKYLNGIPENSRAAKSHGFLKREQVTETLVKQVSQLNQLAAQRGQTLANMALAWVLNNKHTTSVIVGTSSVAQLQDNLNVLGNYHFSSVELALIDRILQ
jgi:L-glyceraldehyde 3-phosphate reductase